MPVVWRAARFAAPLAGTTTEPRRSWPPNAAHFPATDVSLNKGDGARIVRVPPAEESVERRVQ
jgi:hypothetical protein